MVDNTYYKKSRSLTDKDLTIDICDSVRDYTKLPIRRVKGARNKSPILSYGFIIMSLDTGRLLAVKRRYSPGYTVLLMGKYRTGNIADIVSNLTIPEYNLLQQLYDNKFNNLRSMMIEISRSEISMEDVNYVKKRLIDDRNIIEKNKQKVSNHTLEWGWPKGRKKNRLEGEMECAEREVEEETGLKLDPNISIYMHNKTLRESFIGFNGLSFISNFYMALTKTEYTLNPNDTYEIGKCAWINYDDLKNSMPKARVKLLNNAYNILAQERSKIMYKNYNIDISHQTYIEVVRNGLNINKPEEKIHDNTLKPPPGFEHVINYDEDWLNNAWHINLIRKQPNNLVGVFNATYNTQTLAYGVVSI